MDAAGCVWADDLWMQLGVYGWMTCMWMQLGADLCMGGGRGEAVHRHLM